MFIFLGIQLFALCGVLVVGLFPFTDAARELSNGVFSLTTFAGYSVMKSLLQWGTYLALSGVLALLANYVFGLPRDVSGVSAEVPVPRFEKKECVTLAFILIALSLLVYGARDQVFALASLQSEEFYNLAAAAQLGQPSFDIIYPYSLGNLWLVRAFGHLGFGSIAVKIILTIFAGLVAYGLIAYFVPRWRNRLFIFGWLLVVFLQPLMSPSLHRNLLRFLIPAAFAVALWQFEKRIFSKVYYKITALTLLISAVLFFGSPDLIVLCLIVGVVHIALTLWHAWRPRLLLVYGGAFVASVLPMLLLFGLRYGILLKQQLLSIVLYSGHANATPYWNVLRIFESQSFGDLIKNGWYALIFYLPILAMGGLLMYLAVLWKKNSLRPATDRLLVLLAVATILYFRQSFGEASAGRISLAVPTLLVLLLVFRTYTRDLLNRSVQAVILLFFVVITGFSLYFLRYSLSDWWARHTAKNTPVMVRCTETDFKNVLLPAGFVWCDQEVTNELAALKEAVGSSVYVYDDTFSLYYLLESPAFVLIPSFYMRYDLERQLVARLTERRVPTLVYPREPHFFGVPPWAAADERFMETINAYRTEQFRPGAVFPHFLLYQRVVR